MSEESQASALALFEKGNEAFLEKAYAEAAATYRTALEQWDHPAIQFNLSECLIHLEKPLEAYEAINRAMKFGADPFGSDEAFGRVNTRKVLLEGQLATIGVASGHKGVKVVLDGKTVFIAPGVVSKTVLPGRHTLLASLDGYMTFSEEIVAFPRQVVELDVRLNPIETPRFERRFPRWLPWTVSVLGIAAVGGGAYFQIESGKDADAYDSGVVAACPSGCLSSEVSSSVLDLKDSAERKSVIGISMLATGGVMTAVGLGMILVNAPKRVGDDIQVMPSVTSDGAGVSMSSTF